MVMRCSGTHWQQNLRERALLLLENGARIQYRVGNLKMHDYLKLQKQPYLCCFQNKTILLRRSRTARDVDVDCSAGLNKGKDRIHAEPKNEPLNLKIVKMNLQAVVRAFGLECVAFLSWIVNWQLNGAAFVVELQRSHLNVQFGQQT